jgi:hypothetical protein
MCDSDYEHLELVVWVALGARRVNNISGQPRSAFKPTASGGGTRRPECTTVYIGYSQTHRKRWATLRPAFKPTAQRWGHPKATCMHEDREALAKGLDF